MDSIRSTVSGFGAVVIAVALVVVAWLLLPRIDQYLRIVAVDDCGKVAKYETRPDVNTVVTYPLGDEYKKCMKDKGY